MPGFYKFPAVVLAGIAVAGIWAAPPALAEKAQCPTDQTLPRVSLKTNPGKIVYNISKSRSQIGRLKNKHGGASRKRGWNPIGLTLAELQFRMEISLNVLSHSKTSHCATVNAVRAKLGFDRINVYVDKRYRKGSCQYRSILKHEQEHIDIFQNALAVYAPKVERRLTDATARLKPVNARTVKRAADKLQKNLHGEMKSLFKKINDAMDADNARIDTLENYKREQARCSSW